MHIPAILLLTVSFLTGTPIATPPSAAPRVDFSIPLAPLKQKDLDFSSFRNRWSLLFYYLPTCGHCHRAYPEIRKLRATYESRGMAFATIVSGSAAPEDIREFDATLKLDMPSFQDATRQFGQRYGTGSVPLLMLVAPDGTYRSWVGFNESTLASIDSAMRRGLGVR